MATRDPLLALRQMAEHAELAMSGARGKRRNDLENDPFFRFALIHLVEIVGEAARRVPAAFQAKHPEIPWADVIGMRNKLVHGYDEVDLDRLWNAVQYDLPELAKLMEKALRDA